MRKLPMDSLLVESLGQDSVLREVLAQDSLRLKALVQGPVLYGPLRKPLALEPIVLHRILQGRE